MNHELLSLLELRLTNPTSKGTMVLLHFVFEFLIFDSSIVDFSENSKLGIPAVQDTS